MLFVNLPGDWGHLWWPFDHSAWHGWTPTDLIFPFFLFIVGAAGVFSLERREASGATRGALARQALRRGALIVLAGWLMAAFPFDLARLKRLRIPGVLPRIGVVYVLGTWIVLVARRRAAVIAGAAALLIVVHTFLLTGLGYDLTPGGNIQHAVDLALLKGHLWKPDQDPEGIVSTLTAIATMLTGTLAGLLLRSERPPGARLARLFAWGVLGVALGEAWSAVLPINKSLWTGSYVLLTSGLAAALLALCGWLADVKGWRRPFAFFLTFGRNPLLAFVLSGMLARTLGLLRLHRPLYRGLFGWIPDPTLASHAFALAMVLFWFAVLRLCERRGWFWKV